MKPILACLVACLAVGLLGLATPASGQDRPPAAASPEQRLAALEQQLAALLKELGEVRRELQARAPTPAGPLTPWDAVERRSKEPVIVEFGVGKAVFLTAGEGLSGIGPVPAVVLEWDNLLKGGGNFYVVLVGRAASRHVAGAAAAADEPPPFPSGQSLGRFCQQIRGRGIRATGRAQAIGPPWSVSYQLVVDDPDHFQVIK
jgi:hypothetical protein